MLDRACADVAGDASDRDQSAMGARPDDGGGAQPPARRSASPPPTQRAAEICEEDVAINQAIGRHGLALIEDIAAQEAGRAGQHPHPLQCRLARDRRLGHRDRADLHGARRRHAVHVWVDETRPRNQGASLTAWELDHHGVPHTVVADNTGGHLMQHGLVDLVIVGTDRVTANGDVCNKIGTYLKALAARDNGVPFYVALPSPTIDFTVADGLAEIPIEERGADEVAIDERPRPPTAASRPCASFPRARRSRTTPST